MLEPLTAYRNDSVPAFVTVSEPVALSPGVAAVTAVQIVDGVYDVTLGGTTPLTPSLLSAGAVYLEIDVDGETLSPRRQLLAVP